MAGKNPFSFDWSSMEKWFGDSSPFLKEMIKSRANQQQNESWVESYVREMLSGSSVKPPKQTSIEHEITETHNDIIVKIRVPGKTSPRAIKVQVSGYALKVSGLANSNPLLINLPKSVLGESSRAYFQKGILKVKMPKNFDGDFFNDIKVKIR
ncbi:Hsp20/alpha crystallin family protein [Paenibacillus senegalensis]|uniref:Hsp20/alpha crystallin family protein n=1 Tax=Paenibacillus senegalensis TaxID=1465766 RepID=UPI0002FE41A3|nr:Hsp20/alpha crystallin family protein [Paenibacillus senegalensis]